MQNRQALNSGLDHVQQRNLCHKHIHCHWLNLRLWYWILVGNYYILENHCLKQKFSWNILRKQTALYSAVMCQLNNQGIRVRVLLLQTDLHHIRNTKQYLHFPHKSPSYTADIHSVSSKFVKNHSDKTDTHA